MLWRPKIRASFDEYNANESLYLLKTLSNFVKIQRVDLKTRNQGRPILLLKEAMGELFSNKVFVSDVHLLLAKGTVITDKNRGLLVRHGDHH